MCLGCNIDSDNDIGIHKDFKGLIQYKHAILPV